jgi:FMN phosphatase YigB (HAD superfamily)
VSSAIIFDVDDTLLETEGAYGKAFNREFAEAVLP